MVIQFDNMTLYSVLELAEKFNVAPVTIRTYIKQGRIPGRKIGGKWFVSDAGLREFFMPAQVEADTE